MEGWLPFVCSSFHITSSTKAVSWLFALFYWDVECKPLLTIRLLCPVQFVLTEMYYDGFHRSFCDDDNDLDIIQESDSIFALKLLRPLD